MNISEVNKDPSCSNKDNDSVQENHEPQTHKVVSALTEGLKVTEGEVGCAANSENKDFTCSDCGKIFEKKRYLISHSIIHSGVKRHGCTLCGKFFTRKSELTRHTRSHTGEKKYSCELCGKRFTRIGQLKNHINIHNGVKNYECKYCERKFTQKNNLAKHIKIHTGERNYSCGKCEKKYHLKESLTYHMRTHTGERKHACQKCGKTFSHAKGLQYHKENYVCVRRYLGIEIIKGTFPHAMDFVELQEYQEKAHGNEHTIDNTISAIKIEPEVCCSSQEVNCDEKKEVTTCIKAENADDDCEFNIEFIKVDDSANLENSSHNV